MTTDLGYSSLNNDNDPSQIQRLSLMETAIEIMATMLGNAGIKEVEASLQGNSGEAAKIEAETKELLSVRDAIYRGDADAIDRAIREYGPVIKVRFQTV